MEQNFKKPLVILNIAGELSPELSSYLHSKEIVIFNSPESVDRVLSHILIRNNENWSDLNQRFNILDNDIKVISLSPVTDIKSFVAYNGLFVFDESWLKTSFGNFLLDKFFQNYGSITLNENYPSFKELGTFQVVNPFNTGEYLDRLVHHAFTEGAPALSVKSYFDHLLMYLSGLKAKMKVSVPFEVSYGTYSDIFGLQIHFFSRDLHLEDISSCLGPGPANSIEESLMRLTTQFPDFFDFTYIDDVKKVVVTSLWMKGEEKISHRGIMFNNLKPGNLTLQTSVEDSPAFFTQDPVLEDVSAKVNLPNLIQEEVIKVKPTSFTETVAEKITSSLEIEKMKEVISGCFDENSDLNKISGLLEEDETKVTVSSNQEKEDIVQLVKGQIEEENEIFKVSGQKLDADTFSLRIAAGITEKSDKGKFQVKDLGPKIQESIKTGLFDFAKGLNKEVDALEEHDIHTFKNIEVPKIIEKVTIIHSGSQNKAFFNDLKLRVKSTIESQYKTDSIDNFLDSLKTPEDIEKVKQTLRSSIKESLDTSLQFAQKEDVTKDDVKIVIESLSASFLEDENKVRSIVTEAENVENKLVVDALSAENEMLKVKVKALTTEVKLAKDANIQIERLQKEVSEKIVDNTTELKSSDDEELRREIQMKLTSQKILNDQEVDKLKGLLEREAKVIEDYRQKETESRKAIFELTQKETYYLQEMKNSYRQIKAKELAISKAKDVLSDFAQKKDKEIQALREKMESSAKGMEVGTLQTQAATIKHLEKQNLGITRMLDIYKNKLASLATNMQSTKTDDGSYKDEVRKLQVVVNQYKNQIEVSRKEISKLTEKVAQDNIAMTQLKQEKVKVEQILKKTSLETSVAQAKEAPVNQEQEQELKRLKTQLQFTETHFKDANQKIKDLEAKFIEIQKASKQQASGDDGSKVRIAHMEASVKKVTSDLLEAKNQLNEAKKENNKLRNEKTALQHQLDRLKKEADKNKAAAPKKPGSKAA